MKSLFDDNDSNPTSKPLADLLRPKELEEVIGQEHVLGENGSITRLLKANSCLVSYYGAHLVAVKLL